MAKLYDSKNALVAAEVLNDKVVPFFEAEGIPLLRMLTDRGTEYCGKAEYHEYELYLNIEGIEHTKTRARSPQTNGICERFHRTIQEEFYTVAFRKKLYVSIEELQKDLDEWIEFYNKERTHSGKYCFGKTPYQTLLDSKHIAIEKQVENIFNHHRTFELSDKTEIGFAEEQPTRDSLTERINVGSREILIPTFFDQDPNINSRSNA